MARERAIDLTALVEEARPPQGRVPTPRFPSWEDLGLEGAAAAAPVARRRDLRAGAPTRWTPPQDRGRDDERYEDQRDDRYEDQYEDRYDERATHAHRYGYGYVEEQVPDQEWRDHPDARAPLPHELPLPAHAAVDVRDDEGDHHHDAERCQRPPVVTWLLVAAALVLTGLVGYLLGASGPAAEMTSLRAALSSAQQAQQSAEQQLAAAQQAQTTASSGKDAATSAQEAGKDAEAAAEPAKAVASATAKASAKASAAPSASAEPATADAAGLSSGSGSASSPASAKAPSTAPSAGTGDDRGSGSAGEGDSGSVGSDPAAPAAEPVG